jgi:hypothetical protein
MIWLVFLNMITVSMLVMKSKRRKNKKTTTMMKIMTIKKMKEMI